MSVDGKIADYQQTAARFGSVNDKAHLEQQVAQSDGVLFGAGTLRAYGTTLTIRNPELLQQRQQQGKPLQPVHLVCSRSANLDRHYPFFQQPVPRWLLTTATGCRLWQASDAFERILVTDTPTEDVDWSQTLQQLYDLGWRRLTVLGGGTLVASLLAADLIDEFWLTLCPLILGGVQSPTPVAGAGFLESVAPRLHLLDVKTLQAEVFLHYQVIHPSLDEATGV